MANVRAVLDVARAAADHGYDVTIVSDATSSISGATVTDTASVAAAIGTELDV